MNQQEQRSLTIQKARQRTVNRLRKAEEYLLKARDGSPFGEGWNQIDHARRQAVMIRKNMGG